MNDIVSEFEKRKPYFRFVLNALISDDCKINYKEKIYFEDVIDFLYLLHKSTLKNYINDSDSWKNYFSDLNEKNSKNSVDKMYIISSYNIEEFLKNFPDIYLRIKKKIKPIV